MNEGSWKEMQPEVLHDLTACHKMLLREMPEGLLNVVYKPLIEAARIPDDAAMSEALRLIVLLLPKVQRDTLVFHLRFWGKVASLQEINKMVCVMIIFLFFCHFSMAFCLESYGRLSPPFPSH